MHTRVINLLLALGFLWSGFATEAPELSRALTSAAQVDAQSSGETQHGVRGGSEDDHRPVDLPAQALIETIEDVHALLMEDATAPVASLAMARPRPYAARSWVAPYLDGPQRPPSATSFVA